jgi:iron uptake system component EfeO
MKHTTLIAAVTLGLGLALSGCSAEEPRRTSAKTDGPAALTKAEKSTLDAAVTDYEGWVKGELDTLVTKTEEFTAAITAGNDDAARAIYPEARSHWERVETIASEFGDLDPAIDAREAGLTDGAPWTGWHRLEKDLWPERAENYTRLDLGKRTKLAEKLLRDTETIHDQSHDLKLSATDIVEGAQGLLEEVAGEKVTGEEEYWSRTDLWDFQANLDGAVKGFAEIEDVVRGRDAALAAKLDRQFADVQKLLDAQRDGAGFVTYDKLGKDEIKAMSTAVDALGESLAELSKVIG